MAGNLQPIPFATQTHEGRSKEATGERLQNLYLEANPQGSKSPYSLIGTPGLKLFASVGDGPIRGTQRLGSNLFVVSGSKLYWIDKNGNQGEVGPVDGTGLVRMADAGTHVAITTSSKAYAANKTEILQLQESNLVAVTYQDGYLIFVKGLTERFFLGALDDATDIPAEDVSSADTFPDNLVGAVSDHRELWLFGERSTEVWHNAGLADFPFVRAGSGFMERGCIAGDSVSKFANAVYWVGDDLRVYRATGYQPEPISAPWVDRLLESATSPQTAFAWIYEQQGHAFYILTIGNETVCFDITTGRWSRRKSRDLTRWRINSYSFIWRKHIVGDYANGNLYELDLDTYTDNGEEIERTAQLPPMQAKGNRAIMWEMFLDMENGTGLNSGQGSDPQVMLDWTDNGGKTFGSEVWRDAGEIGEYYRQARWTRLGAFRQRSLRLTITDPVRVVLLAAYARLQGLAQ